MKFDHTNKTARNNIKKRLKTGNVLFNFTKVDGSSRAMKATLQESVVPEVSSTRPTTNYITVFDLEKKEWRAIRWDRINSVELEGVE